MTTFIDTIQTLSIADKRALVKSLKDMIKDEITLNKAIKINQKVAKENAKKERIANQIKAAQEKLAKLQAKLA
jgi:hypothetical protein